MARRCGCGEPSCFVCGKSRALSCARKYAYETWTEAEKAAEHARRRTGEVIVRYRCPWGHHWHIGHPSGGRARRLAAKRIEKARRKTLWTADA